MARMDEINNHLGNLNIEDEENEELCFEEGFEEGPNRFELCVVGRFLTDKNINSRVMKSKMADIWRPARGINIKDLKPGVFLFQFFHEDDMAWVINGGPWSFDNAMLALGVIPRGEDPVNVPLNELRIWVQIHGLPQGFMTEIVGRKLGDFFGSFLMYDPNNDTSIWRESMRLRIAIDVRKPLKRKKKICKRDGSECIIQCKYERLGDFCFICGLVTHTERFCRVKMNTQSGEVSREWGGWLRAPPRRTAMNEKSKWLRNERDEVWGGNFGNDNHGQDFSGFQTEAGSGRVGMRRNSRDGVHDGAIISVTGVGKDMVKDSATILKNKDAIGPSEDELVGLNIEERKRRRSGPSISDNMDIEKNNDSAISETVFSKADYTVSSDSILATSARQTSHSS